MLKTQRMISLSKNNSTHACTFFSNKFTFLLRSNTCARIMFYRLATPNPRSSAVHESWITQVRSSRAVHEWAADGAISRSYGSTTRGLRTCIPVARLYVRPWSAPMWGIMYVECSSAVLVSDHPALSSTREFTYGIMYVECSTGE